MTLMKAASYDEIVRRPPKYTPETLANKFQEYIQFLIDNPYKKQQAAPYKGGVKKYDLEKVHIATLNGFCVYAIITDETFRNYSKTPKFFGVTGYIRKFITEHKFSLASADLVNANIIARDLGLADSMNNTYSGTMTQNIKVTSEEDVDNLNKLRKQFEDECNSDVENGDN